MAIDTTIGMDIRIDIDTDIVRLCGMTILYVFEATVSVFAHCTQRLLFFMSAALLLHAALFINENCLI